MIPEGRLSLEVEPSRLPRPTTCGVFIDDRLVALVTLENVKKIAAKIAELEAARIKP